MLSTSVKLILLPNFQNLSSYRYYKFYDTEQFWLNLVNLRLLCSNLASKFRLIVQLSIYWHEKCLVHQWTQNLPKFLKFIDLSIFKITWYWSVFKFVIEISIINPAIDLSTSKMFSSPRTQSCYPNFQNVSTYRF